MMAGEQLRRIVVVHGDRNRDHVRSGVHDRRNMHSYHLKIFGNEKV